MLKVNYKKIDGTSSFVYVRTEKNFTATKIIDTIADKTGVTNIHIDYMDGNSFTSETQQDAFKLAEKVKETIKSKLRFLPILVKVTELSPGEELTSGVEILNMDAEVSKLTMEVKDYKDVKKITVRAGNYIHNVPAIDDRPFRAEDVTYGNCSLTIINNTVAFAVDVTNILKVSNIKLSDPVVGDMNEATDEEVEKLRQLIDFFNTQYEFYKGEMK